MIETSDNDAGTGTVTVGTSAAEIIGQNNVHRRVWYIRNTSTAAQVITVAPSPKAAVAGEGIVLNPGDYIVDSDTSNYICYQGTITAISSAVGGTVAYYFR